MAEANAPVKSAGSGPVITSNLSGTQKAAILMMVMGEKEAAEVFKRLNPKEVQRLGAVMAEVSRITRDQIEAVLDDFIGLVGNETGLGLSTNNYIRDVLITALGEERAEGIIDRILLGSGGGGLESLKWMDPRSIAEIVRLEHPQIIAIVLSYLEPDQAAEVLALLPANMRADLMMRVATLEGIPPQALKELDDIMEKQFSGNANIKSSTVGGLKQAADILNFVGGEDEQLIMEGIKNVDADLGESIEELMFVFENLIDVDDRGIQTILREVSTDALVLALKGAEENLREKIFKNMSKRAAEMMRDDLEARGPVKVADVEAAQKEILSVAKRLSDDGEISLGGGGEEFI